MPKKIFTLILVLLMMSPLLSMTSESAITNVQNPPIDTPTISEIDLARVTPEANTFPNEGAEAWSNPHEPLDFYTQRSEETDMWLESTVINEGSHSVGLEARAMDFNHNVEFEFHRGSQYEYKNMSNIILDLDWYLDSIGTPVDQDYIRILIKLEYRNLYYYLGCETDYSNYTSNAFFEIAGPLQTWNHLHRNLTEDYFEMFGEYPSKLINLEWHIRTYTPMEYTRIFLDDLHILNDTTTVFGGSTNNADFEDLSGWYTPICNGAGDIAQSSDSHSGSSSMNLTTLTFDDSAYARAYRYPRALLTSDNQANLSFWWKLDDYVDTNHYTYARVQVDFENATFQADFYYYMFVGGIGTLPMIIFGNDMKFAADNFNVTGTWNFFDRNIWDDFNSIYPTENLWVDRIEFEVISSTDDAKVSLLLDDFTFAPSILNDMDYEHQNSVGQPIQGWDSPGSAADQFTVTDFAESGSKAANLTLEDDSIYLGKDMNKIPLNTNTELILDFNVYIDTFNQSSEDFIFIQFYFKDTGFAYIIANSSSAFEDNIEGEDDAFFIILQDTIITGEWLNFQLDIAHDYEQLFGSFPDTFFYDVSLQAEAGIASNLTVFFDDIYIYYDAAPEITGVIQNPTPVGEYGEQVWIYANVTDATDVTATFSYRVNDGEWTNVTMDESEYDFRIDIVAQYGVTEYFITAKDAYNKTTVAMDGGDYFTFTAADNIDPVITLAPANGSTVSDITSIEISVSDEGSGFGGAELFIEGASIANITLDTIGISWDTTVISNGEYNITVVAEDIAGNTAAVTHFVTVENLETSTDLSGILLIVIIVAAIGIGLVIFIFVIKKK